MIVICNALKEQVDEVLAEWERLVHDQPWFSLPADHRIGNLTNVVLGLVNASLCDPTDPGTHRESVDAAAAHGQSRREQAIPEHLLLTEYSLLRQAIWRHLCRTQSLSDPRLAQAMFRIDAAITTATNASMWGYHRPEIESMGKWEEGMARVAADSALLRFQDRGHPPVERRSAPRLNESR